MTTQQERVNAAKKGPSARDAADQRLVDEGWGSQEVRNADHEARRQERAFGSAPR